MTKRVLRIKGNIAFNDSEVSVEEIVAALEKFGKMYGVVIVSEMSLKDCPESWKPKQKTLNGSFKRE